MTSKSLFFKLLKEDFKIRIWSLAISILTFFFTLIVAAAMMISHYRNMTYSYLEEETGEIVNNTMDMAKALSGEFSWYMDSSNYLFAFIFVCLSLVMAMSGFAYLYSKKKVDMYHSLPIKREALFAVKVINSIIIVVVPFIICAFIASLMIVINTSDASIFLKTLEAVIECSLLFILNYSVAMLAVMLTGNMLIGILAFLFFSFYFPACSFIVMGYYSTFFETYFNSGFLLEKVLPNISGFMIIFNLFKISELSRVIISIGASAILLLINLLLYKKRPSETASKSISFEIIKLPIKFMIVIFMSMLMYLMAYQMMDSNVWGVFGAVIGGSITHCIMEIIYNQDFKKIFSKKIEMIICIAISLFFVASFHIDLFGYDRYIPKASDIKEVAVVSNFLEGNAEQYHNSPDFLNILNGYYEYSYDGYMMYNDIESEMLEKIDIGNKEVVINLAKLCVNALQNRGISSSSEGEVLISYKLKSGKTVQRIYYVSFDDIIPELEGIYSDETYKKSMYPILSESSENILSIDYNGIGDNDRHIQNPDSKLKEKLLEAYKKELLDLKYETRMESAPFASIRFNDELMQSKMALYLGIKEKDYGSVGNMDLEYPRAMIGWGYYPVFPEFKETIAVLKEMGVDVQEKIPAEDIDRIEVRYLENEQGVDEYSSYAKDIEVLTFTDAEEIEEILDGLSFCDSPYSDHLNENEDFDVLIYLKSDKDYAYNMSTTYYFKNGKLPKVLQKYNKAL